MADSDQNAVWQNIRTLLDGIDFTALTLALVELTPEHRRTLVAPLRAYAGPRKYGRDTPFNEPGAALVGAAILPDAKSVATWLSRYRLHYFGWPDGYEGAHVDLRLVPHAFYLLTERGVPWLGELAGALADRLPRGPDMGLDRFDLTRRLVEHTGAAVPTTAGFVAGWVRSVRPDEVVADLTAHPSFGAVLSHIFDVEETGSDLGRNGDAWPAAIVASTQRGLVDRAVMLDACLARLAGGGRPGATRAFLAVHEALAPSNSEIDARIEAYLETLEAPLSTVATMAQEVLFAAEDRGALSAAARVRVTAAGVRRPEKKLVRAQLSRVRAAPPCDPDERAAVAEAIASSWRGIPADIIRAGIKTIAALDVAGSSRDIADVSVLDLPPDLAAEFAAVAGLSVPAAVVPAPTRPATPVRAVLSPLAGPDELCAAFDAILGGDAQDLTTERLETVVDGLLIAAARDRDGLRELLEPVLRSERYDWMREPRDEYHDVRTLRHAIFDLGTAAVGERPRVRRPARDVGWSGPEVVLSERIFALAHADPLPPLSIALPSWTDGFLDPAELAGRLARAAADGWTPPARELELARLRCAVEGGPGDARTAQPQPAIRLTVRTIEEKNWEDEVTREVEVVEVHADADLDGLAPDGIWTGLIRSQRGAHPAPEYARSPMCWPALAPAQRELISALAVRHLTEALGYNSRICEVLPLIADMAGPFGEATALALGYGLCASRAEQRADARRGLTLMVTRPEWNALLFGRVLGELFVRRAVVMKRSFEALRQAAADGAAPALWPAVREVVTAVLAAPATQPGLSDLLSLAADIAQRDPAPGVVPGLREFAERRGSSRQLVAARRLLGLLSR